MSRRIPIAAALSAPGHLAIRASWLALAPTVLSGAANGADKLALQLHRPAQFEFAGYYAALWQGYYREAGIEVEIKPGDPQGAPPTDPVREIAEGRAQFGTGTVQLLIRAAQGHSLWLLAPIFQQSDARVYYRADGDFSSPGALLNGRIGRSPPSNIFDLELRTALHAEGVDPGKLRSVSTEPGGALVELASHRVDAAVGSAWEVPWQARERGVALKSFNPAAYRAEFYGDSLFTLQRLAKIDPATVQHFREASVKGWRYAFQHPDEVAARMLAELPVQLPVSDKAGFFRYQTELARELARYPDVPLGHSNPERWSRIQQSLIEIGEIRRPADLAAPLYDPGTAARSGTDWQLAILAMAASVALLAGAGFLWRWGQRRGAVPAGAAAGGGDDKPPGGVAPPIASVAAELRRKWTAVRTEALNRVKMLADRMSLQSPFAGLAAAASARLEHLMRRFDVRPWLARLRAGVLAVPSRLARTTSQGAAPGRSSTTGPRPTDLNATLTTLERPIRRRVPDSIKCRFSLLPEPWLCHTDPDAVSTATLDLVDAAVADMPAGGDLILGTRQYAIDEAGAAELAGGAPGDYVRLTVKDNGHGLSPERLDRIFDPVATVRPAVAAAEELTRRLGGFARVESAEGIGTAVHLYFRRAIATGREAQPPPAGGEQAKAAAA
jgi:ABC-type nitrate/sulfonate/bicarbonate transport system substrate-binding protein/signal transduction histidine kinase